LLDEQHREQQQRKKYMKWSMFVSFCGHALLLGLSFIPRLGEGTSGHHEEETSKRWLKWGVMNLLVPLALLAAMFVVHKRFFINLEDTSPKEKRSKWN
jgi:cytochrome bd-type quinol oxidase subunit 2